MNNAEIKAVAQYTVAREMEFIGRLLLDSSEFECIDFNPNDFSEEMLALIFVVIGFLVRNGLAVTQEAIANIFEKRGIIPEDITRAMFVNFLSNMAEEARKTRRKSIHTLASNIQDLAEQRRRRAFFEEKQRPHRNRRASPPSPGR